MKQQGLKTTFIVLSIIQPCVSQKYDSRIGNTDKICISRKMYIKNEQYKNDITDCYFQLHTNIMTGCFFFQI